MTVRIRPMTCGWLETNLGMLFAGGTGRIRLPIPSVLIEHPKGRAVFDTGLHADLANDTSRLRSSQDLFDVHMVAGDALGPQLESLDVDPARVDFVVNSHLHFDHCGGNAALPNATLVVQRPEWAAGHVDKLIARDVYNPGDFDLGQPVQLLDGEHDLFGDGTLVLHPTPGHTAGHQSLWVATPSRPTFLLCDAAYLIAPMRGRRLPGVLWDADAMLASWDRIEAVEAATGARLVATHELDWETSVPRPPDAWD